MRSAGLISAGRLELEVFLLSLDLTEDVPELRPEVDDDERDTEDFPEVDDV